MSFIVASHELQSHLSRISGVVPAKSVLPIIQNIHFQLRDGQLVLTATDLDNSLQTTLAVEPQGAGELNVAFPAKLLQDTIKALPEQPLTFTRNEDSNVITLTTDVGEYRVNTEPGADFPQFPKAEETQTITLPLSVLVNVIDHTLFAASTDELKPAMNGMLFEFAPGGANFVATDAHRLVRYRRTDIQTEAEVTFILPQKALKLLVSAASSSGAETVQIEYNQTSAFFSFGSTRMACRLIDARFPDYRNVIPASSPAKAILNKRELLGSMRRLDIYSNKTTHLGRFKLMGNVLEVQAEDLDFDNRATERLHALYEGEDLEIGFNVALMRDLIDNIPTEDAVLELESPSRAAVILPSEQAENEDLLMLLMPVMLTNY